MFVPCDRAVHVSGHVFDAQHKPISNATVEFYGVKHQTDENGCFYFGGVLAASGFSLAVSKPGDKPYREGKDFDFYDVEIMLTPADAEQPSSAVWHKLQAAQLPKYQECSEK